LPVLGLSHHACTRAIKAACSTTVRSHPNDHPQIAFADPACLEAVDGQGLGLRSRVLLPSPARAGNAALGAVESSHGR